VIYLVDRYGEHSIYNVDFVPADLAKGFAHDVGKPAFRFAQHPRARS